MRHMGFWFGIGGCIQFWFIVLVLLVVACYPLLVIYLVYNLMLWVSLVILPFWNKK